MITPIELELLVLAPRPCGSASATLVSLGVVGTELTDMQA